MTPLKGHFAFSGLLPRVGRWVQRQKTGGSRIVRALYLLTPKRARLQLEEHGCSHCNERYDSCAEVSDADREVPAFFGSGVDVQ